MSGTAYRADLQKVAALPLPWERLQGCNILVTGATGLLGACLVEVLLARPGAAFQVYASGRDEALARRRFAAYAADPRFHFLPWDVTRPLVCDVPFHYIIHAASNASPHFFATRPVEVILSNLLGVRHLLDYGREHALRRLLFVSSGEVYGEGDGRVFSEEYSGYVNPLQARSCYPSSKRAAETLCAAYGAEYGTDCVIARPCHCYGPGFSPSDDRAYAQFLRNVLQGEDIVLKSSGSQFRSWCYAPDCVSGLLHILLKGEGGQAYNVADPTSNITIRQLAEAIASLGGRQVVVQAPSEAERAGGNPVSRSVFAVDRLRALGWQVEGTWEEKLRHTLEELQRTGLL